MTPDLDEIRAALAVATPQADGSEWGRGYAVLYANAPTWLAALCDEVERLRAERDAEIEQLKTNAAVLRHQHVSALREVKMSQDDHAFVVAERDAVLTRYEVLREQYVDDTDTATIKLRAERDAALADLKALGVDHLQANLDLNHAELRWHATEEEMQAWRACADQLNEELREALSYVPKHFVIKHAIGAEALAVYERLKGAYS